MTAAAINISPNIFNVHSSAIGGGRGGCGGGRGGLVLGVGSISIPGSKSTPPLQFPSPHRLCPYTYPYLTLCIPKPNPKPRFHCSSSDNSNYFSLKSLKEYLGCYPHFLKKPPNPETEENAAVLEYYEKLEIFGGVSSSKSTDRIVILWIIVREDDDGTLKKKLRTISSVFKLWNDDKFLVDEWDPDRQQFFMCVLNDTCKCLLENKDRWIYGFSNVSKTKLQVYSDSPNRREPFDLSPKKNTKNIIGCSELYLSVWAKDSVIKLSDKGIHTRQDVETLLEQYTTLEGKIKDIYISHRRLEFDEEKVDQVQGYHHVNYGEHL